jgi:dTDP-glucose pyrophosphorylase/CBS domain-containing protein
MTTFDGVHKEVLLSPQHTARDALHSLEASHQGVVLVLDARSTLLGIITDSDLRRFVLSRHKLDESVGDVLAYVQSSSASPREVVTAPCTVETAEALQLMQENDVRYLPLTDPKGRVVDLVTMNDLFPFASLPLHAVIMAGGFGTRLGTLTASTPKPMLPVGGRPLLEVTIERLRLAGIRQFHVTTHYLPEKITSYFGDGSRFGVAIDYVHEEKPLGTAGALSLLRHDDSAALLVMNGDLLTEVNFRALYDFHREQRAVMTVGVRTHAMKVPYGVVECEDCVVQRIVEKPDIEVFINAGIYLLEAEVRKTIPVNSRIDMPDLIRNLMTAGKTVVSFPILESWIDIGQPNDYQRAQEERRRSMAA